jgi:small-conductance mechanosensitive channel
MQSTVTETFIWRDAIIETYHDVVFSIISIAPDLIGAFALLLVGWLVARVARFFTRKGVRSLDSVFRKIAKHDQPLSDQIKKSYSFMIGQVVYWAVLVFFIAASGNMLGWDMFSGWMDGIVVFLPRAIFGLLILLAGYLLGSFVRMAILTVCSNHGIEQAPLLARLVQVIILVCSFVIGVEHMGLNLQFLTTTLDVILGVLLAGACLAFGLGAKNLVANTIGAQYLKQHCHVGESIKINGVEGEIIEVGNACVVIQTAEGRAVVPAKFFHEQVSLLSSGKKEGGAS